LGHISVRTPHVSSFVRGHFVSHQQHLRLQLNICCEWRRLAIKPLYCTVQCILLLTKPLNTTDSNLLFTAYFINSVHAAEFWGSQGGTSVRNRPTYNQTTRRHIPEHRALLLVQKILQVTKIHTSNI